MKKILFILLMFVFSSCCGQFYGLNRNDEYKCYVLPAYFTGNHFDISTQSSSGWGVELSNDGTKMFISDQGVDSVFQYTLASPFNSATATYDNKSYYVGNESLTTNDIFIRDDGLKLFLIDLFSRKVFSYSLSSANDISTMSYDTVFFNSNTEVVEAYSLDFNKSGTKMYIVDVSRDSLYQYSIDNWNNINTATYDNKSLYVKRPLTNTTKVRFCGNGDALYIYNDLTSFYQFSLGASWDISTATGVGATDDLPVGTSITSFDINSTNSTITTISRTEDRVYTVRY